jgi:hypothetical protein
MHGDVLGSSSSSSSSALTERSLVARRLDPTIHTKGTKVTTDQIAAVNITGHDRHPEWTIGSLGPAIHHDLIRRY